MPFLPDSRTKPYEHQRRELLEHGLDEARALLWHMRTGKSKASIDRSSLLWQLGKIRAVVVLAPTGVHAQWAEEQVPTHCGVPHFAHAWRTTEREEEEHRGAMEYLMTLAAGGRPALPFLCLNTEAVHLPQVKEPIRKLVKAARGRIHLIVDESHMYRTPGAARTIFARTLGTRCSHKTILTGTPTGNSVAGLFSQFEILRRGCLGFTRADDFRQRYLELELRGPPGKRYEVETGTKNLDELAERIVPYAHIIRREDCPDLPSLILTTRWHEPHKEVLRRLAEIRGAGDVELAPSSDPECRETLKGPLARLAAEQRAVCGWGAGWEELYPASHCPRIRSLRDLLVEENGRAVVWCRYREDCERITGALQSIERPYFSHTGVLSQRVRLAIREQWKGTPIGVLVATPETAGIGIDLSAASCMVWYSHTWDAVTREQACERCSAVGGRSVAVTDLAAKGTLDARILQCHGRKQSISAEVARGILAAGN